MFLTKLLEVEGLFMLVLSATPDQQFEESSLHNVDGGSHLQAKAVDGHLIGHHAVPIDQQSNLRDSNFEKGVDIGEVLADHHCTLVELKQKLLLLQLDSSHVESNLSPLR